MAVKLTLDMLADNLETSIEVLEAIMDLSGDDEDDLLALVEDDGWENSETFKIWHAPTPQQEAEVIAIIKKSCPLDEEYWWGKGVKLF